MRFAVERVSLRFRGPPPVEALRELSFELQRGERVALMGASGSGKSSLLRVLAGLEVPTEGRITRDGADISHLGPADRGVGMVLQDAPLYEHLTLIDNVAHPLRMRGVRATDARATASAMLDRVRLRARATARAGEISGGERRRVALARALVTQPSLLLLDEPFASLEPRLRLEMRDLVRELCAEPGCACVHATHDGLEALALGTRLVVMHAGRIVDDGPPLRVWRAPRCEASATLVGTLPMNIVAVRQAASGTRRKDSEPRGEAGRLVGIRPEHLRLSPSSSARPPAEGWSAVGTIRSVDPFDDRFLVSVSLDSGDAVVRAIIVDPSDFAPGTSVLAHASEDAMIPLAPH